MFLMIFMDVYPTRVTLASPRTAKVRKSDPIAPCQRKSDYMNLTHSGAVVRTVGFVWVVAAILVVTGASPEVWLACGVVGTSFGLAGALRSRS